MSALTEAMAIIHLTDTYKSVYLYRGSAGFWSGTIMVDDDRPAMSGIAYGPGGDYHVFLDGTSLQVYACGRTRAEVLDRLTEALADAEALISDQSRREDES